MPLFLHLIPFWNVTMMTRLMWNNQDIQRWLLVLIIVVLIRVWVLFYIFDSIHLILENISQCHWKKLNFCRMRIGVVSSHGSMALRCGIHKTFFSRMIEVNLLHTEVSSVGFSRHQIYLQWQMRKRRKQLLVVSITHHCANVGIDHSWWTRLTGWVILRFGIVLFHGNIT
jgi:hypothetical protein